MVFKKQMKILTFIYFWLSSSMQLCFSLTFLNAYFNPNKSVTIWINKFGEADFELFIVLLGLVLMIRFWFILFSKFFEKKDVSN